MRTFDDMLSKQLQDKEFKKEYEVIQSELDAARGIVDAKMATLYELRLLFTQGEKDEYTREEIVALLDKIATAKEQE